MANAHSFPLLRLPFLAQKHAIQQMFVREQLDFSTLSKRAQWAVRVSTSRQKFNLTLNCNRYVIIEITNSTLNQVHKIPSISNGNRIYYTILELKEMITKFSGLFKTLGVKFNIFEDSPYQEIFELIPTIKQLNVSLDELYVGSVAPNDELCDLALRMAREAKAFFLYCTTSRNFKPQELGVYNLEHLSVHRSNWISLEHLINHFMNCHEIEIRYSRISVQEVNEFFKKWLDGSKMAKFNWCPPMSRNDECTVARVLDGIPCVAVKKAKIDEKMRQFEENSCFMIEQVGGVRALVYKEYCSVYMTIEFLLEARNNNFLFVSTFS